MHYYFKSTSWSLFPSLLFYFCLDWRLQWLCSKQLPCGALLSKTLSEQQQQKSWEACNTAVLCFGFPKLKAEKYWKVTNATSAIGPSLDPEDTWNHFSWNPESDSVVGRLYLFCSGIWGTLVISFARPLQLFPFLDPFLFEDYYQPLANMTLNFVYPWDTLLTLAIAVIPNCGWSIRFPYSFSQTSNFSCLNFAIYFTSCE